MKAKPTWFSESNYIADKLIQLQALGYEGVTTETVTKALAEVGGAWNHYEQWGYKESYPENNVVNYMNLKDANGNVGFNTQLYCESKLASLQLSPEYAPLYKTWQDVADMFAAMNMSPYDHYMNYGAQEGLTINSSFNSGNYFAAKLQQLVKANPAAYGSWSAATVAKYFADNSIDPYQNYLTYGAAEGITSAMVSPTGGPGGQTYDLTTGQDNLVGTTGNDYFYGYVFDQDNTLQSGDRIEGGAGRDTLEADLWNDEAVTPITNGVEVVKLNARITGGGSGANYTKYKVDAERMHGVEEFWSTKSRATVSVEDVVSDSNTVTSVFQSTDPGDIDFMVSFNSQNLRPTEGSTTGKLNLKLIDGEGAAADPSTPLLNNAYDTILFHFNGKQYEVKFDVVKGATATYDQLVAAIQKGIDANAELKAGGVTAAKNGTFTFYNRDGDQVTGDTITLSSNAGSLEALTGDGWKATGTLPPNNNLSAEMDGSTTTECPLIQTNIGLDNVGSIQWDDTNADCLPDNAIFGSRSGNMVVGGMGARDGVERFDIKADRGSWLNSLSSTNNTLRMITLTSGDWNADGIAGISATKGGQVFIGAYPGEAANSTVRKAQIAWQDQVRLLDHTTQVGGNPPVSTAPAGIWDVKLFDASTYTGNINIAAQFTAEAYDKYMKDVDGLKTVYSKYAPDGDFVYTFGTGDDTLNMLVNGGIAADRDFIFSMNMGDGNDFVNYAFDFKTTSQVINQAGSFGATTTGNGGYTGGLKNVTINAGAGDDIVRTWVSTTAQTGLGNDQAGNAFDNAYGALIIDTGAGKNVVYAAQATKEYTDSTAQVTANIHNNIWVLNANTTATSDRQVQVNIVGGAQSLNNNNLSTSIEWKTANGLTVNDEYNVKVLVNFLGVQAEVAVGKYKVAADGTYSISADDMNTAVMSAINNNEVLNKLLVAKDGAGNALIVESLIDGQYDYAGGFSVSFMQQKVGVTTGYTGIGTITNNHANTSYGQTATDGANAVIDGDNYHYFGYSDITGGADADILVTGYADAYVKAGAGNDTIIVGNDTYNKITAGTGADLIHLGYLSSNSASSLGNNSTQAGSYDMVHQAKGDSGTVTSTLAVTAANSIATTSFDVISNFDKAVTNVGDHLVLDSYAYNATSNPGLAGSAVSADWNALKTFVTGTANNNTATWIKGDYNAVTGTFTTGGVGADAFLVYDSDASAGVQFEGVVLVGQGGMTAITGTGPVAAGDVGYITIA